MAHTYSHLYNLPTTGLRFFTVYGPYGRPDMSLQKFTKAIIDDEIINVFNHGNHLRDFTYIDDIIEGICKVVNVPAQSNTQWDSNNPDPATSNAPYKVYNLGNNKPINLIDYINAIEKALGKKAKKNYLPLQPGDVIDTFAEMDDFVNQFDYKPSTSIEQGVSNFVTWFIKYYNE